MTIEDSKDITLESGEGEVSSFDWNIPNDLTPGEYAVRVKSDNGVDEVTVSVIDDIPPENLWSRYDAAQMPYVGGDDVTEWEDTIDGDVASGATLEYVESAIGEQPAVKFDGNSSLVANGGQLSQPFHVFAVGQYLSINEGREMLYSRADGYSCSFGITYYSNDWEQRAQSNATGGSPNQNPHIFNSRFDGADSYTRVDGVEAVSGDTGGNDLDEISIGGQAGQYEFNGYVGEIAVYDGELSLSKQQDIEQILSNKWSIAL